MVTRVIVKNATYRDSISLMKLSTGISRLPGVTQAAVVMATELNRRLLTQAGFKDPTIDRAGGDDMIVAIEAGDQASLDAALAQTEKDLASSSAAPEVESLPKSLNEALRLMPSANLVLISVPGQFAAGEARSALQRGLNVFLFSSNVSREAEVEMKSFARERGLLLMGPDCGTSIINHKVLGFGNVVRPGEIGLVSAAGTGLQEVTTLIHKAGLGVSQAIGTGGGDVSEQVGGITMIQGIHLLEADQQTGLIVLISKPPSSRTMLRVLEAVKGCTKPIVVNFLGADVASELLAGLTATSTLEEAARAACALVKRSNVREPPGPSPELVGLALAERVKLSPTQKFIRGLFSGGTLCYESQVILGPLVGTVYSNGPIRPENKITGEETSKDHSCIDMGAEEFVEGRAHPMIDFSLRKLRILQEAQDPETAVLLLDVELGYGSNPDPASELVPTIQRAKELASRAGRHLAVAASVVGTEEDPQGLAAQEEALRKAGVVVLPSNAQATLAAAIIALGKDAPPSTRTDLGAEHAPSTVQVQRLMQPGLIGAELKVVNIGIAAFADDLRAQNVEVVRVDWKPPAGGDMEMLKLLEKLGS